MEETATKQRPWPKTSDELTAAGYKFDNCKTCTGPECGAQIHWFKTPKGKFMPMTKMQDGKFQPHWADCPNSRQF